MIVTERSIYDRPYRQRNNAQDVSWKAEACVVCVKTGEPDKILSCMTYGFTRKSGHNPAVADELECGSEPTEDFGTTLRNDPSTKTYSWDLPANR